MKLFFDIKLYGLFGVGVLIVFLCLEKVGFYFLIMIFINVISFYRVIMFWFLIMV